MMIYIWLWKIVFIWINWEVERNMLIKGINIRMLEYKRNNGLIYVGFFYVKNNVFRIFLMLKYKLNLRYFLFVIIIIWISYWYCLNKMNCIILLNILFI